MASSYDITISNGTGSEEIVNGSYAVTVASTGYENTSIDPSTVDIVEGIDTYTFTIGATGALVLHVSETGAVGGTAVVGAAFRRCDATGMEYGDEIVTDDAGIATFEFVPFAAADAPIIYYKQLRSDGSHNYIKTLQNTTMLAASETREIPNERASLKTIGLTDSNYADLPIGAATISLS